MQQLEIQYFFPLTEQIPLDLDYAESTAYAKKKQQEMWSANTTTISNGGTVGYTFATTIEPSFTIDVDQVPITIVSKNKPNFAKRWIYKTLGMKWKAK
jgi:hypothetical protein